MNHNHPAINAENTKTKKLYRCPECGFRYNDKKWADKCEAWCKAHHTCNMEITSHAIKDDKPKLNCACGEKYLKCSVEKLGASCGCASKLK